MDLRRFRKSVRDEFDRLIGEVRDLPLGSALSLRRDVDHAAPEKSKRNADHADTANQPDDAGDRRVIGEDAKMREQVIPVVNYGFVAANREPR